ncbi:hypothetical protein QUF64_16735 [Anaerolineales bacterium HSG6]|nr:hypothetical protein [Anaerolineales bacterium HSG6]
MSTITIEQIYEQFVKPKPLFEQLRLIALIIRQYVEQSAVTETIHSDPSFAKKLKTGQVHPIMMAYGLWQDEPEFDILTAEIYQNRLQQPSRPEVSKHLTLEDIYNANTINHNL